MLRRIAITATLVAILGQMSCKHTHPESYNFSPTQMAHSTREDEILFGTNRLNEEETKRVYGEKLQSKGYELFAVSVLNNGSDTVDISRGGISFIDCSGDCWLQQTGVQVADSVRDGSFLPVMITPGLLKGFTRAAVKNGNEQRAEDYRNLDFPGYAQLGNGMQGAGFVIFKRPEDNNDSIDSGTINIKYKTNNKRRSVSINLKGTNE